MTALMDTGCHQERKLNSFVCFAPLDFLSIWVIYYLSHLLLRLCSFVQSDARTSPNSGAFPIELWRLLKKCFPNMDRQHDEILYFFVVIPTQDTSDVRNKGLCQPFGFLKRKGEHTVRNLHLLSKKSTLISRENCRFFWVKNSWKCCGFGLFSCWQLWFHEKNCQFFFWWKTRENVGVL